MSQNLFKPQWNLRKFLPHFVSVNFGPYSPKLPLFPSSFEKHYFSLYITMGLTHSAASGYPPSLSPSRSPTRSPTERHGGGGRMRRQREKQDSVEKLIDKHIQSCYIQRAQQVSTITRICETYLCNVCLLINGHKDFVEKRFKVIALDAVHDKAFQRGH